MGEVYAALDVELEEQVAVKLLHADLLGDSGATQRFRRELQLARKVTHPNVCRLFDLGRHVTPTGDVFFLTMELVEGETLGARLGRTGRLAVDEARPIVEQLVQGLAAAHHAGIVHRDLKPSNVMLSGDRAVIMDFGLARRDSALTDGGLTSSGKVFGTLQYMAPEQLQGQPVTERTDIYALGLLLYEITTGTRPFGVGDSVASALTRLTQTPPPPSQLAPDLPRNWARTIAATLEVDPQHRPESAQMVWEHLQGPGPRRRWRVSRRQMLVAGAIPAGAMSLYWAVPRLLSEGKLRIPEGALVMMTEVTGWDKSATLTEVFRQQLAQSARFNLLDRRRVIDSQRQMARKPESNGAYLREVALRSGAKAVVYPTVAPVGDGFTVTLRIESLGSSPSTPLDSQQRSFAAASEAGVFGAIHEGARWLRSTVGEDSRDPNYQDRAPEAVTTASWEALRLFSLSEELKLADKSEEAVTALREAVKLDPNFALAQARLADILTSLRRHKDGFAAWADALSAAKSQRLTTRESLRIQGLYSLDAWDWSKAEYAWKEMVRLYAHDPVARHYLADVHRALGRTETALSEYQRADAMAPGKTYTQEKLLATYLELGRAKEALGPVRSARLAGRPDWAWIYQGIIDAVAGQAAAALQDFAELGKLAGSFPEGQRYLELRGRVLANQGQVTEAIESYRLAIAIDSNRANQSARAELLVGLAYLHFLVGEKRKARALSLQGVSLDRNPDLLSYAGSLLARIGEIKEAEGLLRELPAMAMPRYRVDRLRLLSEIRLGERRYAEALTLAEQMDKIESRCEPRELLARVLIEKGESQRAQLIDDVSLRRPVLFWNLGNTTWPGMQSQIARRANIQQTKQ